jgi:gas vesicle protein
MRRKQRSIVARFIGRGSGSTVGRQYRSLVTGFIGGAMVGAASTLLFAPRRGQQAREQLRQRTRELQTRAQTVIEDLPARARQALARGRVLLEEATETAGLRVQDIGQRLRSHQTRVSEAAHASRNGSVTEKPPAPAHGG